MPEKLRTNSRRLVYANTPEGALRVSGRAQTAWARWPLVLAFSLLAFASMAAAQGGPPAYQAAPPPATGDYRAAPPPQPGEYQAAPAQPAPAQSPQTTQGYATPPPPPVQPYYQGQPQGYPPPPPGSYPVQGYGQPTNLGQIYVGPPRGNWQPQRPRRGMMIAGASILGGSYLLSMVIGAALLDNNDNDVDCSNCKPVGRWLFVPVIGPFAAMADSHGGDVGLLLLGMVELVGAGLLTGGIIRYRNSKRGLDAQGFSWNFEHNRKLSLNLQSGERSAGPRMRFTF